MNCQDIHKLIYQYCDGEVSPEEYTDISQHLNSCTNCQYMYQLTLIESDILREKDDVPQLSPAFTSLVMRSLQANELTNSKGGFSRFNRKIWLSSLTTVAAVIALFLYLPHQSFIKTTIFYNETASIKEQQSSSPSVAFDINPVITGQTTLSDSSKPTEPKDTGSAAPKNSTKSVPEKDNIIIEPIMLAYTDSAAEKIPSATPNVSRSFNQDSIVTDSSNISIHPHNIPERLKFVQESNEGSTTVFNYASLDGTEFLQLTLVPYNDSVVGLKSGIAPVAHDRLIISKDILLADKKMTVTFSGNLSIDEMSSLANTIEFQETSSK